MLLYFMQKIDPYKSRQRFEEWKNQKITEISKSNAELLRNYILDMEKGINTNGTVKGPRSPIKLLSLVYRIKKIMLLAENKFKLKDLSRITEEQIHDLFLDMHSGKIVKANKQPYKDVADYIKRFKSFWHWYMKRSKKEGKMILDITTDLSAESRKKPTFVYFTNEQLEKMMKEADYETRVFMIFLFDTGIRSPTEALNIRVSDFTGDFEELNIREEIAKTFGRKIRLMMSRDHLRTYVRENHLKEDDLLFTFQSPAMNKRLKLIGKKILGKNTTLGREIGSNLTMYDFRHSSACYWLPRYKSRSALLYRFGWTQEKEIHYYTELLGMKDTITEEDMLMNVTKTELEKEMVRMRNEMALVQKQLEKRKKLDPIINRILNNPKLLSKLG
ncbi:hypothetical protein COY79_05045 [Candidatus Pacearchaeota archaeon CG_4_10_14_0_8_um_filter_35_169]|nr:MAG: hypothetical protein COY79_05045 [Candidatus Pacearchaeota archaeon CG_4_10_14_0_8_um_filter_35_169]